jgi:hypothetical protein
MRPNFGFSEDYCSFHTSNAIRPNFSEFHRIFLNFSKIDRIGHLRFFLLRTNFQTPLTAFHHNVIQMITHSHSLLTHFKHYLPAWGLHHGISASSALHAFGNPNGSWIRCYRKDNQAVIICICASLHRIFHSHDSFRIFLKTSLTSDQA